MKRVSIFAAFVALLMSGPLVGTGTAATIFVDDDGAQCPGAAFSAIQPAVTAAVANDTIRVCAGTYAETVVVDNTKTGLMLTALGPAKLAAPAPGASAVGFEIGAAGVQLDHFEVSGYAECGIRVTADRAMIQHNNVHHNGANICVQESTGTRVRNNVVDASTVDGIVAFDVRANQISGNRVSNSGPNNGGFGVWIAGDVGSTIEHNLVTGGDFGVVLGVSAGGSIRNNTVRRVGVVGVYVTLSTHAQIVLNSVQHSTIGMVIEDCGGSTVSRNSVARNNLEEIASFGGIVLFNVDAATIIQNSAHRNGVSDCFWDENGSNVFLRNSCGVEAPPGGWD